MPSLSPLIAQIFDDPHAKARNGKRGNRGNRTRVESKGRLGRRTR